MSFMAGYYKIFLTENWMDTINVINNLQIQNSLPGGKFYQHENFVFKYLKHTIAIFFLNITKTRNYIKITLLAFTKYSL